MKKTLVHTPEAQSGFKAISFRARLGGSLVMLALVGGIGFAASRPAHTAGGPIPVTVANALLYAITRDSDNVARQPVSVTTFLYSNATTSYVSDSNLYTVPAGKRLVIDYVTSVAYNLDDANSYNFDVITRQNGSNQNINFNELPDTAPYSAASQKVELCADPGTTVRVDIYNDQKNAPSVLLTIAGHLVDVP